MFEAFGRGDRTAQSVSTVLIKDISQDVISTTRFFFLKKMSARFCTTGPQSHTKRRNRVASLPAKKIEVQINAHLPRKGEQALGGGA